MKLAPIPMHIIRQETVQNFISISTLFKTLQSTDPQIWIGVSLRCNGPNP